MTEFTDMGEGKKWRCDECQMTLPSPYEQSWPQLGVVVYLPDSREMKTLQHFHRECWKEYSKTHQFRFD